MDPIGLYIHIPFCKGKCPYCDFYSVIPKDDVIDSYTSAVIDRLKEDDHRFDTIYFGGGTPSVLGAERIANILSNVDMTRNCEVTVECNPSDTGSENSLFDFRILAASGVNRISMGLQSANDTERKTLGRRAGCKEVERAIERIYASGIDNISLDLMLGIPYQTPESLDKSITFCCNSGAKHISAYILSIEKGTRFFQKKDTLSLPCEDDICGLYEQTVQSLNSHGFHQYEISNFAKKGFESRHNLKYWRCEEYLGIGASAHSFVDGKRFFYPRSIDDFIAKKPPVFDCFGGDKVEFVMLALRLSEGLNFEKFEKKFGEKISEKLIVKAQHFTQFGFIEITNEAIKLTSKGFLLSNSIISELTEEL